MIEGGSATSPRGFVAGGVYAGIKEPGRGKLDVGILASNRPANVAAMFTRSTVKGAAVIVSQRNVRNARARGVIVNAGISNVATGAAGVANAEEMCALAADPRYHFGRQIKIKLVHVDYLMKAAASYPGPHP